MISEGKTAARRHLRQNWDLVRGVSTALHADPEPAWKEVRAHRMLTGLLADRGFAVERRAGGLDTAFHARAGNGPLHVAFVAEYDALPGLGHACGHNLIAAAAIGAALMVQEVDAGQAVTVHVLGTPAEEGGGGKIVMLESGEFDGLDAALMMHPGPVDAPRAEPMAVAHWRVTYRGVSAHAGAYPHLGVNAADAFTVAQVAIGLLRQQLMPGQMVHGIVTHGGQATNVIPGRAEMRYTMRATDMSALRELEDRMAGCFSAGALATGCEHQVTEIAPAYAELAPDPWLSETIRAEMLRLGRNPLPENVEASVPLGSTDMGNISQVMPGIHPVIGIDSGGAAIHQPAFTAAAAGPSADKAVLEGAIMLARTVVRLAETPAERDRVLEALHRRAAA